MTRRSAPGNTAASGFQRSRARRWLVRGLFVLGVICALPAVLSLRGREAVGVQVREAFLTPVGPNQAQVSVIYDVDTPRGTWMAWGQGNAWWQRQADPIMPLAEAVNRVAALRATLDGMHRPVYRVLFDPNDPAGTALILFDAGIPAWGLKLAVVWVTLSLLLSLPLPLWERRRTRIRP